MIFQLIAGTIAGTLALIALFFIKGLYFVHNDFLDSKATVIAKAIITAEKQDYIKLTKWSPKNINKYGTEHYLLILLESSNRGKKYYKCIKIHFDLIDDLRVDTGMSYLEIRHHLARKAE